MLLAHTPPAAQPTASMAEDRRPHITLTALLGPVEDGQPFRFSGNRPVLMDEVPGLDRLRAVRGMFRAPWVHAGATAEGWRPLAGYAVHNGRRLHGAVIPTDSLITARYADQLRAMRGTFTTITPRRGHIIILFQGEPLGPHAAAIIPGTFYTPTLDVDGSVQNYRRIEPLPLMGVDMRTATPETLRDKPSAVSAGRILMVTSPGTSLLLPRKDHHIPADIRASIRGHQGNLALHARPWEARK